ncbi:MAG: 2'-deoxycytidine 5'-triphosphate deaminase [Candidatus Paceibacterota bacterium]|jgi:deoxycytidine triphosphate deaminase
MSQMTGVFSQQDLKDIVANGRVKPLTGFSEKHIGPASIDITTTGEAYRVDRLLPPSQLANETVRYLLPKMGASKIDIGKAMEVGCTYVAKASIDINFPPGIYGYLNAKSSSGRNFLFVRSLADGVHMFDCVDQRDKGYTGELWLVIQPLAYPIIFTDKECYNQLRVFNGDTRFKQKDLDELLLKKDLLYRRSQEPYNQGGLSLFTHDGSVLCTLHSPPEKMVGYKAKRTAKPLDLSSRDQDPKDYFEPVYAERFGSGKDEGVVCVEAGRYYLLSTNEMLKIPKVNTAELTALDPRLGFFFTHFAGFFDPGFFGTATLEVFAPHDEFLRHKKPLARFILEKMRKETVSYAVSGNYSGQIETQLPKQFVAWK